MGCLIFIFVVKCYWNAKRMKERRIRSTFSRSSFQQPRSILKKTNEEFHSSQRDEENCPSNSLDINTATTKVARAASFKSVDSTSAWVEDVLNDTYETSSSSSSCSNININTEVHEY